MKELERGKQRREWRGDEEIRGDCTSSRWQSSVLLSQDLNHSYINTSRLGGFIQYYFIHTVIFLYDTFLSFCCSLSLSLTLSVWLLFLSYTHTLSLRFRLQCFCCSFCVSVPAKCNQMRWPVWHLHSLALRTLGSKCCESRESTPSEWSYVQTGFL